MIDQEGHIKLIDFGFAKILNKSNAITNCGTMGYTAPEIICGKEYSFSADIWSFGIMMAELLSGNLPFEDKSNPMII